MSIMSCAQCGTRRDYPGDFPNTMYAICKDCHSADHEKRLVRRERVADRALLFGIAAVVVSAAALIVQVALR